MLMVVAASMSPSSVSSIMVASASVMASVVVTPIVVTMVMMIVPIVVIPFIVEPNSIVEARADPNDGSSIVVIIPVISCFNFNADTYLGNLLWGSGFIAVTC
jgi:hypothetical protein